MKNKTKKIVSSILAFVLSVAMLLPVTSGMAVVAEAAEYVGDYGAGYTIAASEFEGLTGDVVFTIDYEIVEQWEDTEYEYHNFSITNMVDPWTAFTEEDIVFSEYEFNAEWNNINVPDTDSETVVILSKDAVEEITSNGVCIQVYGLIINNVTVTVATQDDYYVGDWNTAYTFKASELAELTGDVTLTMEYTTVSSGYDWFNVQFFSDGTNLTADDFVDGSVINEYDCVELTGSGELSVVIKEDTMARILASGDDLGVRVYGVIVKDASLEVHVEETIELDASYPEANENGDVLSPVIPAEAFEAFDGAVAITLKYIGTGDLEYPWYNVFTCGWTKLYPVGNTNVTNGEGTINLVLSESDVATVIAEDGLMLQLGGVYFTQAVLTEATPDDYYVGDYNIAHTFTVDSLSSTTGDVTLTLEYTTVSEGYSWPFIQLTDLSDWSDLMTDAFADGTETNEYACIGVDVTKNEMTIVIKEEVIQAVAAANVGLAVRVYGVIVQDASLKGEGLVGTTGNIEVDDTSSSNGLKWVILPDGVPEDGQIHFITYEIYDETNTLLGTLEYRGGNGTWPNIWIAVDGVTEEVYADFDSRTEPHVLIVGHWDQYFPAEDYTVYRQYTYKVTEDTALTEQISNVETISWDATKAPGWLVWEPVEGAGGYEVAVKRNGNTTGGWIIDPSQGTTLNVADCINESGTYTVSIATYGGKDTLDSDEETLLEYVYTRPELEVGVPNKIWWTTAEGSDVPTVAHWNPVAGAKGYEVRIEAYDAENPDGDRVTYIGFTDYNTATTLTCSRDFAWQINALNDTAAENGMTYVYKVAVRALSGNIELMSNALNEDTFVSSGEYKAQEDIAQEIADEVMLKMASGEDIGTVIDKWGKDAFGDAMKLNSALWEMLTDAEGYSGITVSDTVVDEALNLDAASIGVLGAGLNAESGTVGLVITEAEEKIEINKDLYHNATQMDITLNHEGTSGTTTISELDVPMVITMPAPENIEPERLVILHEHEGVVEPVYPEYNAEDETITFSVTGFSTFAIAGITLYDTNGKEAKEYESDAEPSGEDDVTDFVSRLYTVILERDPDEAGLAEWVGYLENGTFTGAEVAKGFIMSDEFLNTEMTNEEFVQILYSAFFGRAADESGLATWVGALDDGYRKSWVFAGFANSDEFAALCEGYGVEEGSIPVTISEQQPNLSEEDYNIWLFVERMYTEVLDRPADLAGIQEWVGLLKAGTWTGAEVASGFILSDEFQAKEMTNEEYVQIMYSAFFGREADPTGLETWVNALETDFTKEFVFAGFANSDEFGVLCESYGITRGSVEVPEQ